MVQLRVSEIYNSVQGEGVNTGLPTTFLRFAGCNMRCPGWPCDTPHAVEPSIWSAEAEKFEVKDLIARIEETTGTGIRNICWTGGEPFLQPAVQLQQLYWALFERRYSQEVFTNGSKIFPSWSWEMPKMMDWKLKGSGESNFHVNYFRSEEQDRELSIECREQNALELDRRDGIKFVVTNLDDFDEAVETWKYLFMKNCDAQFWVGAAWNRVKEAELVQWLLDAGLPWKLNVQVHKYIWPANERGV
jgi:7-carboxy-7-deazaguanine synthase